jgi:hypothetical protein
VVSKRSGSNKKLVNDAIVDSTHLQTEEDDSDAVPCYHPAFFIYAARVIDVLQL